ncbi:hypothetical protein YC2023_085209 [Brassica napus]
MEEIGVNGKEKNNKDDEFHVRTYYNYKTVSENRDGNKENSNLEFFKIKKKEDLPQWSYKLTSELEELEAETEENIPTEPGIRSRKAKRVVVFTDLKEPHNEIYTNLKDNQNSDQTDEMALIRYSQQSDFCREIIKGSMRSQRQKTKKARDLLNFKYSVSLIRYEDLLHIWNCTEKIIYLREVYEKFWENVNDSWLICQKKIEYVIKN